MEVSYDLLSPGNTKSANGHVGLEINRRYLAANDIPALENL